MIKDFIRESPRPKAFYIYSLEDPRNDRVRYIGLTGNPRQRMSGHTSKTAMRYGSSGERKVAWLKELATAGLKPVMRVLLVLPDCSREDAEDWERYYIRLFSGPHLTNAEYCAHSRKLTIHELEQKVRDRLTWVKVYDLQKRLRLAHHPEEDLPTAVARIRTEVERPESAEPI